MSNETQKVTVLITGAGSELSFSIFKACRLCTLPLRIVACDMDPDALGLYWADSAYCIPGVRQDPEGYLTALREIVRRECVDVIFPTPDPELEFLPPYRETFQQELGCWLMINPPAEMARFSDKWLAYEWYLEHGLSAPRTARADDADELDRFLRDVPFPVILKPRQGGGSRSLFLVHNHAELQKYLPAVPRPLVQEYLAFDDEEYTAGTFRTKGDNIYVIVLRRKLKFGMTNKAEVVFDQSLVHFCQHVIQSTRLEGINNIQFRRTDHGPQILEINPRFSGTTGIRAHFGFNEPEMVIRQFVLNQDVPAAIIRPGRVLRYMHEEYVQAEATNQIVSLG